MEQVHRLRGSFKVLPKFSSARDKLPEFLQHVQREFEFIVI